jgi:hypothetical protein
MLTSSYSRIDGYVPLLWCVSQSLGREKLPDGGRGGASVCCRIVRICGAEWACVCAVAANASCAGSTPIDSGDVSYPEFADRSSGHQRSRERGAITFERDRASNHHGFPTARIAANAAKEKPRVSSGRHHNIASPAVIGAVFSSVIVVSDRRSQRGRWNARRAADGKPNRRSWRRAEYAPHYRARRNS